MNISGTTTSTASALIVGATSSLAQALCRELAAAQGMRFVLMGRDEAELEVLAGDLLARYGARSELMVADLLDPDFSPARCIGQLDFDLLVLAAGDMGADDPSDADALEPTVRLNYVIPAQLAALAAQKMAARKGGSIVIISSVAGDRGRQSNFAYGSAKAGLNAFASGLRNRYDKEGVHVMTVKPGFIDTSMTWGMKSPLIAPRTAVAQRIVAAWKKKKDVIYAPFFWRFIMLIIIHIPEKIFKRLKL